MSKHCCLYGSERLNSFFLPTDANNCINCCYQFGRYSDVIKWCNSLGTKCHQNPSITLLRAKSAFQLYQLEQRKLRFSSLHPKTAHVDFSDCYMKAKEAVVLLGQALDAGLLDEEGQNQLDIAMMDLAHRANLLGKCNRCFLCRNKLQIPPGKHESSQLNLDTTDNQKVMSDSDLDEGKLRDKSTKKVKLIQSHLYPKAILKRMATGFASPLNQKVFVTKDATVPRAPGELTHTMLCPSCEDTLSAYGESQFLPLFFDKIYESTNPSSSSQAKSIEYDDWLYNFCIGLIFRNLLWYSGEYVNESELYKLFSDCRSCLLSLQNCGKLNDDQAKPDIYLLITPMFANEDDLKAGLMNHVLSSSCMSHVGTCKLDSDTFKPANQVNAQFFWAHMGCINILVKFKPSEEFQINESFLVQWNQGSHEYHIPSSEERKGKIPPGLWTFMRVVAEKCEVNYYERRYQSQKVEKRRKEEPASDVFGVQGLRSELLLRKEGAIPASDPREPKQINLLPPQFNFSSPLSCILPENHHILLHHTFHQGKREGFSVFLAVGEGAGYSFEKPYLILRRYDPGLEITAGFFISRKDLSALNYLSEGKLHAVLEDPNFFADVREKTPDMISFLLDEKGFLCLESLLLRVETVQ